MKIPLSAILPGQASEACCTCAAALSEVPRFSPRTEKPYPADRRLGCCPRVICGRCIHVSPRSVLARLFSRAAFVHMCYVAGRPTLDPAWADKNTLRVCVIIGKRPLRLVLPLLPGRQRGV